MTVLSFLRSPSFLGVTLLGFSVGFPPFDDLATVSLPVHMLQHTLIALSGFFLGYTLFKRGNISTVQGRRLQSTSLFMVMLLLIFWHLPVPWDLAVLSPAHHAIEHLSFLLIGMISGSVLIAFSDNAKVGILCLGLFGQLAYAVVLYPASKSTRYIHCKNRVAWVSPCSSSGHSIVRGS